MVKTEGQTSQKLMIPERGSPSTLDVLQQTRKYFPSLNEPFAQIGMYAVRRVMETPLRRLGMLSHALDEMAMNDESGCGLKLVSRPEYDGNMMSLWATAQTDMEGHSDVVMDNTYTYIRIALAKRLASLGTARFLGCKIGEVDRLQQHPQSKLLGSFVEQAVEDMEEVEPLYPSQLLRRNAS